MVEESEKKFEAIMNKLFNSDSTAKSKPNTRYGGAHMLSGKKRLRGSLLSGNASLSGLATSSSSKEPSCQPWNRDDLLRRLSTFKSMTWFAKPQVVSPLACARRGWINIDVDTITCESCDARLLYSTPTGWTQQQVEKAALLFSKKLENGHKSLCPWLNNACSEQLAQFPVAPRADLTEDYKKRIYALSQIITLPVILLSAISEMGSPQLDRFLREGSASGDDQPDGNSRTEVIGDAPGSASSLSYYQAQKLISLFGWEPHVLPYKVDFKDGHQVITDVTLTTGLKQKVSVYSLCTGEGTDVSSKSHLDPSSIVLDCKLCGACVGLWTFSTIQRPMEYLRFVGPTEVNGKNASSQDDLSSQDISLHSEVSGANKEGCTSGITNASTSLGFTIAGGPPPATQNYSATISLPVIGHNLRLRLSVDSEDRGHLATQLETEMDKDKQVTEGVNASTERGVVTDSSDSLARNQSPKTVAESSDFNVNLTAEDITPTAKDGEGEPNSYDVVDNDTNEQSSVDLITPQGVVGVESILKHKTRFVIGHDGTLPPFNNATEFDPIKQHRHFCPWIMPSEKSAAGWQQVLSALEGHKDISPSRSNLPSSVLIELDDPVESVRRLFQSPSISKRTKVAGGSD